MAIHWLEWEAKNTEQHIRHQGNDSEKLIGMKRLPCSLMYCILSCVWRYKSSKFFPLTELTPLCFFGHPASMSVPDTFLEFVDGVGVSANPSTGKRFIPINFSVNG
jgi:hypothetical protein